MANVASSFLRNLPRLFYLLYTLFPFRLSGQVRYSSTSHRQPARQQQRFSKAPYYNNSSVQQYIFDVYMIHMYSLSRVVYHEHVRSTNQLFLVLEYRINTKYSVEKSQVLSTTCIFG